MKRYSVLALLVFLFGAVSAWAAPEPPWSGGKNCSGTITNGGTAQPLANLPAPLHGVQIQNESTDALAFSEFTTTPAIFTNGSWTLSPASGSTSASSAGSSYNSPPTYAPASPIYIVGATTGDKFTCSAW